MEDLLIKYRKEFREKYALERDKERLADLINNEITTENLYRRGILLNEIKNKGLEKYSEEIIDGINEILTTKIKSRKGFKIQETKMVDYILSEADQVLNYGLEYITKWKMYNELFRDK